VDPEIPHPVESPVQTPAAKSSVETLAVQSPVEIPADSRIKSQVAPQGAPSIPDPRPPDEDLLDPRTPSPVPLSSCSVVPDFRQYI
jgi:hypothetical protein